MNRRIGNVQRRLWQTPDLIARRLAQPPLQRLSIVQKSVAEGLAEREDRVAMKRIAIHFGLIGAFLLANALSVSPQLHERVHTDADQPQHECAVTLIAAGNYYHCSPPPLIARVDTAVEFSNLAVLNPTWVQSVFLAAHIFAHGPPPLA
jgi:hypothetical protein